MRPFGTPALALQLGVVLVALTGCAAPRVVVITGRPAASASGDHRYIAVAAAKDGRPVTWLGTSPIRLWFEPTDGTRTAVLDAPVNTYSARTETSGGLLWSGEDSAGSLVGCVGTAACEAGAFVGDLVSTPARQRGSGERFTIATAALSIEFARTAAVVPPRSCDLNAVDPFPCSRFVSASGTDGAAVVDRLRTVPLTAVVTGSGARRTIAIRDGSEVLTAPLQVKGGAGVSAAGTVRTTGSCAKGGAACPNRPFVRAFFAGDVAYRVHEGALVATSGDRTLELEAR